MNKLYVFLPLALVLGFGGVYAVHQKDAKARAAAAAVESATLAKAEAARKAEAERQAREDAERRSAERVAEEKRKEEEKRDKWEAAGREIATETAGYREQAAKRAEELKQLEAKLAALREQKDAATRAEFAQALEIERARVSKRNAELELQSLVEAIARKGAGTTLGAIGALP